jgi:hypothetical protein
MKNTKWNNLGETNQNNISKISMQINEKYKM